jgi:PAS domain S-box-containing protein
MANRFFKPAILLMYAAAIVLTIHAADGWTAAQDSGQPHTVLVFHSFHRGLTWTDNIAAGIDRFLESSGHTIQKSHEFMDTNRIFTPTYLDRLAALYRTKYSGQKFAAIICSDDLAFNFLLNAGRDLFGRTPTIFCGVNHFEPQMINHRPEITGVLEALDIRSTLNIALALHPEATRLVVIGDQTLASKDKKKLFFKACRNLSRSMEIDLLENHTMAQVQSHVGKLQSSDIAIWLHFTMDSAGQSYSCQQSAEMISSHSTAPLYSFWDFQLDHGIVGGMLTSGFHQGRTAAAIAYRIIQGESPEDIPVMEKSSNHYMFDFRQLERFGIDTNMLPAESIVINQPVTFYAQHKKMVWITGASFGALALIIILLLINISHRRRAQVAIRTARDRYQNMFNNTAVALLEEDFTLFKARIDQLAAADRKNIRGYLMAQPEALQSIVDQLIITDANPAALNLYGAQEKSKLVGCMDKVLTQDSSEALVKLVRAVAHSETYFACETVGQRLDGRQLHQMLSMNFPSGDDGWDRVVVSVVDITERKRSVEALRRSEDRFRTVFDHAACGMAMADLEGNYIRCNIAFCKMVGYDEEELLQMNWLDITHTDDINLTLRLISGSGPDHTTIPKEKRYIHKNGRIVSTLCSVRLVYDDRHKPLYFIIQMQDITQIKAAQAKFKAREDRYRHIFEADLSGFYISTPEGEIILCNNVFADILGFASSHDVVGMDMNSFYKDPGLRKQLVKQLSKAKRLKHIEVEMIRKDGILIHVRLNAIGRFDDQGKLSEILGYLMDITHQKSLETQLLHAQKMESIGTMAGGLAHDFNNLLMGIIGNVSLLLRDASPQDYGYKRLESIEQYAKSGSDLTHQLLGFAKGGKYEVRVIDVNRLIEKNSKMFARTHKEINVRTSLAGDLWVVEADHSQIDQVLYNMYVNAWQAMENSGDLTVSTSNRTIDPSDVTAHGIKAGDYVQITVTDSGIGMDAATIQRIYDPFFTTKERGRGTGLGLASAYGIIKNHSGFIRVNSKPDQGTTFYIFLPATDKAIEIQTPDRSQEPTNGSGTILLIDDEEIVIESVGCMIEHLGYRLIVARSGKEAIELYKAQGSDIDLVILDMIMPDMNGSQTFDRLKATDPDVQIVLSTGYSADGQASEILQRGCQGLINKPFTLGELSEKISRFLQPPHLEG